MDGQSPDECSAINSGCNACRKMIILARVCKSTEKSQRRSNWNSNQKSSKNRKRTEKKVRNLRAGWINEEVLTMRVNLCTQ